jgi:hypothetical protein
VHGRAPDDHGALPELSQIADRAHPEPFEPLEGGRPDPPQPLHRQRMQELELAPGPHLDHAPARSIPSGSAAAWPRPTPAWPGTCWARRRPSTQIELGRDIVADPLRDRTPSPNSRTAPVTSRNASSSASALDERRVALEDLVDLGAHRA